MNENKNQKERRPIMEPETIYVIMRSFYIDSEEHRDVVTARRDEKEAEAVCSEHNSIPGTVDEYWYTETELS